MTLLFIQKSKTASKQLRNSLANALLLLAFIGGLHPVCHAIEQFQTSTLPDSDTEQTSSRLGGSDELDSRPEVARSDSVNELEKNLVSDANKAQRELYKETLHSIKQGLTNRSSDFPEALHNYPLYPYLEYQLIRQRLSPGKTASVEEFLEKYDGQYVADRLRKQLLTLLASRQHWKTFTRFYRDDIANDKLQCEYAYALYKTGQNDAGSERAEALWLSGSSRPKACDPLFKRWMAESKDPEGAVWDRIHLAVKSGNLRLARYLSKKLSPKSAQLARNYFHWHRKPQNFDLNDFQDLRFQEHGQAITAHVLRRQGFRLPWQAADIWRNMGDESYFSDEQRSEIIRAIAYGFAKHDDEQAKSWLLTNDPNSEDEDWQAWRIRLALKLNDWDLVQQWILALPAEERQSNRWQYWLAFAQEQTGQQPFQPELRSAAILEQLAQKRDYYGFLAADRLQIGYSMEQKDYASEPEGEIDLNKFPAMQRAFEFYALGDINAARREWYYGSKPDNDAEKLNRAAWIGVAHAAEDLGWHQQAILAMAAAKVWNDLNTRFPIVHEQNFQQAAIENHIDIHWLYALARQESAFATDAKSSAGAMGLLQLMPATAKQVARSKGIPFKKRDLLSAKRNIDLGSNYLASLYQKFNGNRALATAAYNAGPHRVTQWINKLPSSQNLAVWIETIPFKETRHYVQNVLTYTVIYGHLNGQNRQLVLNNEYSVGRSLSL